MLPTLESVLNYQNPQVIRRYDKDYPNNRLSGQNAFKELKQYLWLCNKHKFDSQLNPHDEDLHFKCTVHTEMKEIDDMWHTFILFTQDYTNFCTQFFGHYMHHAPATEESKQESQDLETVEKELTRYLIYIEKNLGEEAIRSWFSDLIEE